MNETHQHGMEAFSTSANEHRSRLLFVLGITFAFMVVEAAVGVFADSLALLADAGHMLTDVAALSLALLAIWFAHRPATEARTYGYYRLEILATVLNALLLLLLSAFICYEAYQRLMDPPAVKSIPLILVATGGLVVNLVSVRLLMAGSKESLNVKGAFIHMLGDSLSSAAAITAGVIMLITGWRYADPLFAAGIGLFILPRTWILLQSALSILLESTPSNVSVPELQNQLLELPGVKGIHDLHVWTITSGFVAMSGHLVVGDEIDRDHLIVDARELLHNRFDIEHVTLQVESSRLEQELQQPCLPGTSPCYAFEVAAPVQTKA